MLNWLKNFGIKIWQKIEDRLAKYIASLIVVIFLILCFALKEWFLRVSAIRMYNLIWSLLCVSFVFLIIYFLFNFFKGKKRLTDAKDIIGTIGDWFNDSYIYCPFEKEESIFFQSLDDALNIKKGSSRKYLPALARRKGYGVEIGNKTFKLVSLTAENDLVKILREFLPSEKNPKERLIPTYDIDNKLRWPKGTAKNCLSVYFELEGKYENLKFEDKGNGNMKLNLK